MKTRRFFSVLLLFVLLLSLLIPHAAAAVPPFEVQAQAALLVDQETGGVIYAKNEHQELYPASLTKIMTALLTMEAIDSGKLKLDQVVTVSDKAMAGLDEDGSSAGLKVGEKLTVENLLYCMLVVSANEACNILALEITDTVDDFVDMMNAKAETLKCENTHFVNPTGLHDSRHYTSAWDMYLIAREAMKHDLFMKICDTASVTIPATNLSPERELHTTNHLLSSWRVKGYRNPDAHGIKTGSTSKAGLCLVSSAARGSMHFVSVVLGAQRTEENGVGNLHSFSETTRMFNYAFDNFSYQTVLEEDEVIQEVEVALSRKVNYVTVQPGEDIDLLLPNGLDPKDLKREIHLDSPVDAPIKKGEKLGTMTLSHNGKEYATVDLRARNDVEASKILLLGRNIQLFFARPVIRVLAIIVAVLLVLFLLRHTIGSRRGRYGRGTPHSRRGSYRGRRRH